MEGEARRDEKEEEEEDEEDEEEEEGRGDGETEREVSCVRESDEVIEPIEFGVPTAEREGGLGDRRSAEVGVSEGETEGERERAG